MKKTVIKIKGEIINQAVAKTGYCYTLKEHKTNKQYYFFNTWKIDVIQGITHIFFLEAKAGKGKYYLLFLNCRKTVGRRRAYKQATDQEIRTIQELRQTLETKQREIDNKPEYQAQNIFDQLARIYYKSNRNAAEQQLISEVNNLFNGTYIGKEWMFAFRTKQNYFKSCN